MLRFLVPGALSLAACTPGGSYKGVVVDGFTKQPEAEVRILAKAKSADDMTCRVREVTTDAQGKFAFTNLCSGERYTLHLADESLMLGQSRTASGDETIEAPVTLTAWRAPAGSGVYKLADDQLNSLRTFSDVATETILESDEKVRYPTLKPSKVQAIKDGEYLVLAGKDTIDRLEVHPLVLDQGKRKFAGDVSIEDHVYIGVAFKSDTEWEPVEAAIDDSKVQLVSNDDHQVKYLPADALPQGRYAILGDDDKRSFILDFGTAPEANAAKDPEE